MSASARNTIAALIEAGHTIPPDVVVTNDVEEFADVMANGRRVYVHGPDSVPVRASRVHLVLPEGQDVTVGWSWHTHPSVETQAGSTVTLKTGCYLSAFGAGTVRAHPRTQVTAHDQVHVVCLPIEGALDMGGGQTYEAGDWSLSRFIGRQELTLLDEATHELLPGAEAGVDTKVRSLHGLPMPT